MRDVLVVGAGVAGSAVAIHLARRGRSVLLIDRAEFPRRKACGEGLFPAGVQALREVGVLEDLVARSAPLNGLKFVIDGRSAEAELSLYGATGLGVQRELLDAALLRRAEREGVEVRCGVGVRDLVPAGDGYRGVVDRGGRELDARFVVAADGLRSGLRRRAGLERRVRARRYGVTAHFAVPAVEPRVEVHFQPGYELYLTPVARDRVNVALLTGADAMPAFAGDLRRGYLERVGAVLPSLGQPLDEPLAAGPFAAASRRAYRANLLLAGDAAGFFDGVTGEGMSLALSAAPLAAEAIDLNLRSGAEWPLARYDRRLRRLSQASTLLGRLVLFLAARRALGRAAVANLARRPEAFTRLVAVNTGELPLSALRPADLRALLLGL